MDRINELSIYGGWDVITVKMRFHGGSVLSCPGVKKFFFYIGAVGCGQGIFIGAVGMVECFKSIFTHLTVPAFHQCDKTAVGDFDRVAVAVID